MVRPDSVMNHAAPKSFCEQLINLLLVDKVAVVTKWVFYLQVRFSRRKY